VPGDLFIPFHTFYGPLVGKRAFVHRMGVRDVGAALGRPAGLDQALQAQAFAGIVLDWKTVPGEFPFVDARYHLWWPLREGVDSVRMFAGAETSPSALLVPTLEPPPIPAGGHRLADFESGWQMFAVEGPAFGPSPAPAPPGLFGHFAADSTRQGPAPQGALRSAPFTVDRPHLRFTLSGPADPGLRVSLLDQGNPVRVASPSGKTVTVDWDTSDLLDREVVLLVEDHSPAGGLALDDLVAY
jgi:YD repeat-containing protein